MANQVEAVLLASAEDMDKIADNMRALCRCPLIRFGTRYHAAILEEDFREIAAHLRTKARKAART